MITIVFGNCQRHWETKNRGKCWSCKFCCKILSLKRDNCYDKINVAWYDLRRSRSLIISVFFWKRIYMNYNPPPHFFFFFYNLTTAYKTSHSLCGESRPKNHQEHLQKDKRRKKQNKINDNKKAQAATTPAASTYNTTVDTDGPKPQENIATAYLCEWMCVCVCMHMQYTWHRSHTTVLSYGCIEPRPRPPAAPSEHRTLAAHHRENHTIHPEDHRESPRTEPPGP